MTKLEDWPAAEKAVDCVGNDERLTGADISKDKNYRSGRRQKVPYASGLAAQNVVIGFREDLISLKVGGNHLSPDKKILDVRDGRDGA